MVIAMLEALGTAFEQAAVGFDIADDKIVALKMMGVFFIFLYFYVGLTTKTGIPILLRGGCRNGMDFL